MAAIVCASCGMARAQELSGSLSLTSDYRLRGVSQNERHAAPQGELDWNGPDGWSAGLLASKVNFEDRENTSVETDVFAGKHFDLRELGVDLTVFYYGYPDHRPRAGSPRYSMVEPSIKIGRQWSAAEASLMLAWSPDFFGGTGSAWDVEAESSYALAGWLSISTHTGRQWVAHWDHLAASGLPYDYVDLGVMAQAGKVTFDLRFEATDLSRRECAVSQGGPTLCSPGIVASVRYSLGK